MRPATKRTASAAQTARTARAGSTRPSRHGSAAVPSQLSRNNTGTISPIQDAIPEISSRPRSPVAGTKRKERDFDLEGEETNIHVVVRCRGRNDREVRENSGVVVSTEGARGKTVNLSMGPNALNNKTYHFDRVFSPAADQFMVYDDVVAPILDEMIAGYNCTIFAYGQTGTGKTYTMSGDMNDTLGLLSDAAGIIPRTLYSLFSKLEADEKESTVKVSFIELYNEELRDLLASDDSTKLKLFEADQKKGHTATIVQGMEESHIKSAAEGIRLLQLGSHKRQVAATKCNDLSSRSHTVFTTTVYTKRAGESGDDWVVSGKLNLVDLAGSENIQRSGAENKRAAEAGLINKSLLTLGRVINALVDKGSHIPYRESKLTRLLQDSLGGRTKTCIIATISPAKSNLEETISTLDYAFRAKNIRNKPQVNQPILKKTLLREYTAEIQQLKSELIATRQRNGVYLSNDHYEQITVESESRRILSEEQKAKIETMEANLRHKIQDLYSLTNNLAIVKKDNESTKQQLDETSDVLQQTELVLENTKQNLEDETSLRKAHQATEQKLSKQGHTLLTTLDRTVEDVNGLRAKIRRKSDIQAINRTNWQSSSTQVQDVTKLVEKRVEDFQTDQQQLFKEFAMQLASFVATERQRHESEEAALVAASDSFKVDKEKLQKQCSSSRCNMNAVLGELLPLREEIRTKIGDELEKLTNAAAGISTNIVEELGAFHTQLNNCYRAMGKDLKDMFNDLEARLAAQKLEAESLRQELQLATLAAQEANSILARRIEADAAMEREQAAADRDTLISQVAALINANGTAQEDRSKARNAVYQQEIAASTNDLSTAEKRHIESIDSWLDKNAVLSAQVKDSRNLLKTKLKTDWEAIEQQSKSIEATTKSIDEEMEDAINAQAEATSAQMKALDGFATRAKAQSEQNHEEQRQLVEVMADKAEQIYATAVEPIAAHRNSLEVLQSQLTTSQASGAELTATLLSSTQQPLSELREAITSNVLTEYISTGSTPQKASYDYPRDLASTASPSTVLGKKSPTNKEGPLVLPVPDLSVSSAPPSPAKTDIYTDTNEEPLVVPPPATADSLREVPVNISLTDRDRLGVTDGKGDDLGKTLNALSSSLMGPPPSKRAVSADMTKLSITKNGRYGRAVAAEGRENVVPSAGGVRLSASVGSGERRLRSSARQE